MKNSWLSIYGARLSRFSSRSCVSGLSDCYSLFSHHHARCSKHFSHFIFLTSLSVDLPCEKIPHKRAINSSSNFLHNFLFLFHLSNNHSPTKSRFFFAQLALGTIESMWSSFQECWTRKTLAEAVIKKRFNDDEPSMQKSFLLRINQTFFFRWRALIDLRSLLKKLVIEKFT